jgi:hypothetical protein
VKSHRAQRKKRRRTLAIRHRRQPNPGYVGKATFHEPPLSGASVDVVELQVTQARNPTVFGHPAFGYTTITGTARLRFTRHFQYAHMPIHATPEMLTRFDLDCTAEGQRMLLRDCDVRRVSTVPTFDDTDLLDFDFSARYMNTVREQNGD